MQTSLVETGISLLDFQATRWTVDKQVPQQEGNFHPTNTPMGLYPTADGFLNLAATSNKNFKKLCKLIDREKMASDPRFASPALRGRNKEALNELIANALRAKTSREWFEMMVEAGLPCGPVYSIRGCLRRSAGRGAADYAARHPSAAWRHRPDRATLRDHGV